MKLGKKGLDLSEVRAFGEKVVLPAGAYNAQIVASEVKETQKGGQMILATYKILDGQYAGVQLTDNYNIVNENETAVKIGLSKLKAILEFGGHSNPSLLKDTDELIGLKLAISISVKEESFINEKNEQITFDKNHIEGFKELMAEIPEEEPVKMPIKEPKKENKENKELPKENSASEPKFPWE